MAKNADLTYKIKGDGKPIQKEVAMAASELAKFER